MTRRASFLRLAIVAGCAGAVARPAGAASTAMPEVLLVVDGSASMQHRVYDNSAPTCGGAADQRSRWIALREIISGSFLGYKCANTPLPYTSEALVPPLPPVGAQKCITGLPMVLGTPITTNVLTSDARAVTAAVATTPVSYGQGALNSSFVFPSFALPHTAIPANSPSATPWPIGAVKVRTRASATLSTTLVATLVTVNPLSGAAAFRCAAAGPSRVVISDPLTVAAPPINTDLVFNLTDAGLAALHARKLSLPTGASYIAIVPAAVLPSICSGIASASPAGTIALYGATAPQASLTVTVGTRCPSEGPLTHATASGLNDVGTYVNTPWGRDGLLDIFGQSAKFALLLSDTVLNQGTTAPAGFSFGPTHATYWGTANHGMMDPFLAGSASVPITRPDTLAARAATYAAINTSLQNHLPNGPTTLGAQLEDVLQYVGPGAYMDAHFKTVVADPANGDPYATCRQKLVVVLSDGGANFHDGTVSGREIAIAAAAKLNAAKIPVYVVAVGHPAVGGNGPSAADLQFLNDLAVAGGTTKAIVESTPGMVVKALAPAIASVNVDSQVNGRPESTASTGLASDVQHSFQGMSQFDLSQPLRSKGILEERIFTCDTACKDAASPDVAQVCGVIDFGARLASRVMPRRLYTHKTGSRIDATTTNLQPGDLGIGTVGAQPKLAVNAVGDCATAGSYDLSVVAQRNAYRDELVKLLTAAAGTCRQGLPLGAPSRSQPAALDPVDKLGMRDASFQTYAKTTVPTSASYTTLNPPGSAGRPTMLFAATHDGLLHAFRTDRNAKITTKDGMVAGDELWAWLPKFTLRRLSSLKLITTSAGSYLGGSVSVGHFQLRRLQSDSDIQAALGWRAVVVVGAGEAGAGYVAIDVTAPDDPRLLWEITPDAHCWGASVTGGVPGPTCVASTKFQHIGRSVGKPYITRAWYKRPSEVAGEHSVVVLPFGMPPSLATVSNLGVEGTGQRGAMVVDLETGDLVRKFVTTDLDLTDIPVTVGNPSADLGYFWSDPACFPAAAGAIATRCFLGDSRGMLWRIDLSADDPAQWKMSFFHDAYGGPGAPTAVVKALLSPDRAPVLSAPSIAALSANNTFKGTATLTYGVGVVYGTGGGDDAASASRLHVAYALRETLQVVGGVRRAIAERAWAKKLAPQERFIGPPVVFGGHAYWATFLTANVGSCEQGTARLWGARYDAPQAPSDPEDLYGAFTNPASPTNPLTNLDFVAIGADRPSPVDVQPVPPCRGKCAPTDIACTLTLTGGTTALGTPRPRYEVSAAVANPKVQSGNQTPPAGPKPAVGTIAKELANPRSAAIITGWDRLVD